MKQAGYCVGFRAQGALALARAERIAKREGLVFMWAHDDDADPSWLEQTDARGHYLQEHTVEWCWVVRPCTCQPHVQHDRVTCPHAETVGSLGGIFDATPEYRRVVEAELALEATLASARHAVPKSEGAA